MALQIPITGVAQDYRTPGAYAEILFAQGASTQGAPAREVVLAMPMLSTGSWTSATLYRINSEKDASDGAGVGSPLHRAARLFLQANKDAKLWGLPVAETSGGSPIAATGTVTYTTTATGRGTATVTICGEVCSFTFLANDSVTTIAAGMKAAINAKTWLPVTADNSSGILTITAKLKGTSQGTASVGVIRYRAAISSGVGTTVATSGSFLGSGAAGVEGSTTEAANLATALAVIATTRKYYVVISGYETANLSNLASHVSTKSEPRRGLRSVGIAAYTGSLATGQTLAIARNYERLRLIQQINSEHDCAELAAQYAAILQKHENTDTAFNFNGYRQSDWLILPVYSDADRPSGDDQNDAINDGISIVATDDSGAYLVQSCCTRSKNSGGTVDDFRATQSRVVSVTDEFVDEALINFVNNHGAKKFADDERLSDGSVNTNQRQIRSVVRPSQVGKEISKQMDDYEAVAKLQNVATTKQSIRTVKTGGRLECSFDLEVINWMDQFTARVAETSVA